MKVAPCLIADSKSLDIPMLACLRFSWSHKFLSLLKKGSGGSPNGGIHINPMMFSLRSFEHHLKNC